MNQLSIGEALIWFAAFLLTLALNWWVSTPPAHQSKPGWSPGYPGNIGDSDEPEASLMTQTGTQSAWQKNGESTSETYGNDELDEKFFYSVW